MMEDQGQAIKYAYLLFKARPRSQKELEERLKVRGFSKEIIGEVVEDFKKKGLVDDLKFSKLYAVSKIDIKRRGLKAINFELKKKGVDGQIIDKAIEEIKEDYDEYEMVKEAAAARLNQYKGMDSTTIKRRLYNFLIRRGFDSSVVWKVIGEVLIKNGGDDCSD